MRSERSSPGRVFRRANIFETSSSPSVTMALWRPQILSTPRSSINWTESLSRLASGLDAHALSASRTICLESGETFRDGARVAVGVCIPREGVWGGLPIAHGGGASCVCRLVSARPPACKVRDKQRLLSFGEGPNTHSGNFEGKERARSYWGGGEKCNRNAL
ncbi:hypothetical protein BCR34DRAFT_560075 [Clohesyomyces aquaticus]|uniref:Uncharacterized protein n=1 Tax=Clohesyomyces aquaticus TaxID=1231657 RepID=A0A1Y1ZWW1_9PLEO|nr:hypothetical protein BCR34DRAFT_560075 [Clohesyomyces aquaticus]